MKECLSAASLAGAMGKMKAGKTDYSSAQSLVVEMDAAMARLTDCLLAESLV